MKQSPMAKRKAKKKGASPKKESSAKPGKAIPAKNTAHPLQAGEVPSSRWELWLRRICFFGIVALSFLMSFHTLTDTDIFWHLKTGEIIWQTHRVPHQDLYSFTRSGEEWIDAQWLFQVAIYLFYRIGGYTSMVLFGSALTAITWFLILLSGYERKRYFRSCLLVSICLFVASLRLKLRPEIFSFFFLTLELVLINLYQQGKKWALYPIPFLIMLWVNSQGLWPIGIFLLVASLVEQVLALPEFGLERYFKLTPVSGGKKEIWQLGLCLLASGLLLWVNPYGWKGVIFPLRLLWEISSSESFIGGYIAEFLSPFSMDKTLLAPYIILIVFSGLIFLFSLFSRRLFLGDFVVWGAFLYLSATARRNVALFAISTAILGTKQLLNFSAPAWSWLRRFSERFLRLRFLGASLLIIGMVFWSREIFTSRFFIWNGLNCRFGVGILETEYPVRASEFLKSISGLESAEPLKIFTDLFNAGYLIWAGYPGWRVYVDPRLEQVYSDQFIRRYAGLYNNWETFIEEDQKYNFDLVAVTSYQPGALNFLRNFYYNPQWALIYFDGNCVVFLKNKPSFYRVIQEYQMDLSKGLNTPLPKNVGGIWMATERNYRGVFLLALKQPEWALVEFQEGLKYNSEDPDLIHNIGSTLMKLNRYQEALPYLEKYARIKPESLPNQTRLGLALALTGNPDRGIRILQGVLNISPDQIDACVNLAKVYEMINANQEAYKQWQRCIEIFQQNPIKYKSAAFDISESLKRYPELKAPLLRNQ